MHLFSVQLFRSFATMRKEIIFLFVLWLIFGLPCISLCQPAVIDSVSVDELKGELIIYGELGSSKGFVFVDSVSLPITFWSDSICRATIPVSGKGSAGSVEIGARGYRSQGKMLSSIEPYSYSDEYQLQPYFSTQYNNVWDRRWHFRLDLESRILKQISTIQIVSASDSRISHTIDNIDEKHNSTHQLDTGILSETLILDIYGKVINYPETAWYKISSLDSQYKPITQVVYGAHSNGTTIRKGDWGSTFLPRPEYFNLTYIPVAFPKDSNYFGSDIIKFFWTESTAEVQYEIQISSDSSFQIILHDSIVSHSAFNSQNVTKGKYFWRVRVRNSVGAGLWSNIAGFQYSLMNSVKEDIPFEHAVYPNPLSSKTTFSFTMPQEEFTTLKIYNPLGIEVATLINKKLSAGDQRIEFDASHLPSGVYYYRLQIGGHSETKPMVVAH